MADTNTKVLSQKEIKISSKGDEELLKREKLTERDGNTYLITSEIRKKKIKKEMLPSVIERMSWQKFGLVKGQPRGTLEPGIIVTSKEEFHIIDRQNQIEQDLGDKLKDSINNKKMMVLKEMKENKDREQREKLAALSNSKKQQRVVRKRNRDGTIKVTGFNPNYGPEQLVNIFQKAGPVKRCTMPSKNFAFIEFEQSIHAKDAFEMFNDETVDGCVLRVILLDNKN
jgi:hypothetical protein